MKCPFPWRRRSRNRACSPLLYETYPFEHRFGSHDLRAQKGLGKICLGDTYRADEDGNLEAQHFVNKGLFAN